jgi:hypothetical protein
MATKQQRPHVQIKTVNTAVRGVNNVVFYVDTLSIQTEKNGAWLPHGYQVRIKHYNNNKPFPFDHYPENEELAKLWRWR